MKWKKKSDIHNWRREIFVCHSVVVFQLRCEAVWRYLPKLTRPWIDARSCAAQPFSLVCARRTAVGVGMYRGKWTGCIACVCSHIYKAVIFVVEHILAKIIVSVQLLLCNCHLIIRWCFTLHSPCHLAINWTRINTFTLRRLFPITILLKLHGITYV